MNAANKLRLGYELSYDDMLDIVLHNDKSFIEYILEEESKFLQKIYFKDQYGVYYKLLYQRNLHPDLPEIDFLGHPKRVVRKTKITLHRYWEEVLA